MQTQSELPSSCVPFLLSRSVRQLFRGQLLSGIGNSLLGWVGGLPNNFNMGIAWNFIIIIIIIIIIMCWFITDFCVVPLARFIYAVQPTPT
jgi:p-aminobenzoyl-glutamate transporter AbgT